MKIHIVKNDKDKVPTDYQKVVVPSIKTIEPSTCTEINVGDCLDYFLDRDNILLALIPKLRYGGKIIITGVDLLDACRALTLGKLSADEGSKVLYNSKLSCSTLNNVKQILQNNGLKLNQMHSSNLNYYVVATRSK